MSGFRLIGIDQPQQWQDALAKLPHSYWHTWRLHDAVARGTGQPAYLFVYDDPAGLGSAACSFTERAWQDTVDIYSPAGFSGFVQRGACPGLRETWTGMTRQRGYVCGYFALHPEVASSSLHEGLTQTNYLYTLDLSLGASHVLAKASRSVRRSLSDWRETGMSYVEDRQTLVRFMLDNYSSFMASVGANPRAIWSRATLLAMCADPSLYIVGVADAHGICAAHSFAIEGRGAEAHLHLSVRDGRRHTSALLAWGLDRLAAAGVHWLQMGGGIQPGDTLAQSKEKFRPARRPLQVACEIYDLETFSRLCTAATQPARSTFFPPYRANA